MDVISVNLTLTYLLYSETILHLFFFFFFFFGVFIQNCYLFFTFSIDIQAFDTFDIKVIYMSFSKKHRKKRTNLFQSKKEREH